MAVTDDSKSFSLGSNPSGTTMEKSIYVGNGIVEQLKHFAHSDKCNEPLTSNYFIMGSKMYEIYNLLIQKEQNQINPDLADLKIKAITEYAYICPNWDYLKYPIADISYGYGKTFTNEIFEEYYENLLEEDGYLIYVGREGYL